MSFIYSLQSNTYYMRAKMFVQNAVSFFSMPDINFNHASPREELPVIFPATDKTVVSDFASRADIHGNGLLHPTAHLLVYSPDHKFILLQKRSSKQDFSKNKITTSVSGHISRSDTYLGQHLVATSARDAIRREAGEEIGTSALDPIFVRQYEYQSHWGMLNEPTDARRMGYRNNERAFLFTATYPAQHMETRSDEVSWLGWYSVEGLKKLAIKKPSLFSSSFLRDLREMGILPKETAEV